ncbi:Glutathione transferase GST 23 [Vitis vinifera]|uniref:glutathione transferase n=1 Tax=Vitis vinifera TaxID=29760 RepID=A0A438J7U0_VITVI|nr:Glutathione transferase GST 23 [Vitis vinifera]
MAREEVTLLGMWASPLALRIEWALKCKGIWYKCIDEDLLNKSQRLLTHNPIHKKIPVLLHGGKSIPESLVILEYIDETWKQNPLLPEDPYERAMARFWAKFVDEKVSAPSIITVLDYNTWSLRKREGDEQEKSKEKAIEELRILEKQLEGKKFFGGESVGFLDIVCGWIAYWLPFIEDITGLKLVDETSFPALSAWFKAYLSVPWVKELLPPPDKLRAHLITFRQKLLSSRLLNI